MFIHLFDKIYAVTEKHPPKRWETGTYFINFRGFTLYYKSFKDFKESFVTTEKFFSWMMDTLKNPNGGLTFVIMDDETLSEFMTVYCDYLGISPEMYRNMVYYNGLCMIFMENGDTISSTKPAEVEAGYREVFCYFKPEEGINPKITTGFEHYPAELCVNCLDQKWARKKFEWFRIYDLYNLVKKVQQRKIRTGYLYGQIMEKEYEDDRCAKAWLDKEKYDEVVDILKSEEGCDTALFEMPLEDYVTSWPEFGYNQYHYFKFNYYLARQVLKEGYRIDAATRHSRH